jgi:hypothetical protein
MKRIALMAALLTVGLATGCVERRFVVNSNPPGALVYHNGIYLGTTPVDGYIVYYGKQHFRLIKEGYETLDVVQTYPPPWYEWPGIDFITENIVPFKVRDVRTFCYDMRPLAAVSPEEVHLRAEQLRARGQTIGAPRPLPPAPPPPPPPPPGVPPQGAILGQPTPAGPLPALAPPQGPPVPGVTGP